MRKCCRMFTRPDWGKTGMKVYCGAAANIPVLYLFSTLDVHWCVKLCIGAMMGHICVWLLSVSSLQRLRMSFFLERVVVLEHLLCPLSVIIMCECGRVSHLAARIPNLRCHVFVSWISMIVSRFKNLTGNRRTWIERPGIIGHRSSRLVWSGGDRKVRMAHCDPPTHPRLLICLPWVCEGRPVLGDKLGETRSWQQNRTVACDLW